MALNNFERLVERIYAEQEAPGAKGLKLLDFNEQTVMEALARLFGTSNFLWEDFLRIQWDLDIPARTILEALESYTGTGRRFELRRVVDDIMVVEDYAHHPTEIKATLEAAKRGWSRRVVAVFEPHRYTRLSKLMTAFATAFNQADVLVLTDIYPAGEDPIPGVDGRALYEEVRQFGHKNVHFEPDLKRIGPLLGGILAPGDIVLVLGAGNVNRTIPDIVAALEARS